METEKRAGISSFTLKLIAIITMTVDHASAIFSTFGVIYQGPEILGIPVWRIIGRIAFPIFAFMIAEGADRTRNIKKYIFRLAVFSLISEIPFDIAFWVKDPSQMIEFGYQNVYFTLTLGLIAIALYKFFKEKNAAVIGYITACVCAAAAFFLQTDYSWSGVLCIFIMYLANGKSEPVRKTGIVIAAILPTFALFDINSPELFALLGLIPIFLYNGEKGRKINKYVFYAFYPVHLLLLRLIVFLVLGR